MDKDSDRERIRTVKGQEQAHDEKRRIMMTGNYVERIRKEALLNFLNIFYYSKLSLLRQKNVNPFITRKN